MIKVKMEIRRIFLIDSVFSSDSDLLKRFKNPYGIIKLLLNIVANANDEITTIEIAAENPPKKTSKAKNSLLF